MTCTLILKQNDLVLVFNFLYDLKITIAPTRNKYYVSCKLNIKSGLFKFKVLRSLAQQPDSVIKLVNLVCIIPWSDSKRTGVMQLLKTGVECCLYIISPLVTIANELIQKVNVYQHMTKMDKSVVRKRTLSDTIVVIPFSMYANAVNSAVQMVGNVVVYFVGIFLRPSAELVSFISGKICNNALYTLGVNPRQLAKSQLCSTMNWAYRTTINVALLVLNGILMFIFALIVMTMVFTLLLTPFVPIMLVFTVVITSLIALSLVSAISKMTKTVSSSLQKTFGVTLLAAFCIVFMVLASVTSCAFVMCWIFVISSVQIVCVILSAFMIVSLFAIILILTIIGKVIDNKVQNAPRDTANLYLTFSKKSV